MARRERRGGINATPPPDHTEEEERPRLWLHQPVTRSSRAATDFAFIASPAAGGASALPPGLATEISAGRPSTDAAFSAFATMTTADQIDAAAGDLMARGSMTRTRALGAVTTALSMLPLCVVSLWPSAHTVIVLPTTT